MTDSLIPDDLVDAYKKTNYIVLSEGQGFTLRVDEYSSQLAELHTRHHVSTSAFMTACNPCSEIYTLEQNASRQNDLERDLMSLGCVIIPGIGQDPEQLRPGEPSFLALGVSRFDACELGKKYGQNAIVFSGLDAVPRLVLLR